MSRRLGFWNVLCGFCLCATSFTQAEVVEFVIDQQTDVGTTGYELLAGKLRFEIDPRHPGNVVIADVELAPVVESGRVQFAADIRLFRPKDPAERTAAAWVEIPNRGGNARLSQHVISEGMTQVNIGWEFDVPAVAGRLRIEVPAARQPDGSPLRGVVSTTLISNERVTQLELTPLAEYRPIEIDGPDSRLIIRTAAAFPGGTEVPRSEWSLQDNQLHLKNGFEPGKTYEIFYLAEDPPVAGLGYAAVRDAIAWLKHDPFHAGSIQHVCAFGSSQCGRFLRDFVYLGFNTDEQNRQVADGILSHVAGAGRLVLNERWSTPRAVAGYYTSSYPFADAALPDPVSGLQEGIMENPRVKHPPKIFYINMAAEYWGAGRVAALTHTTPDGQTDVPLPDNVRSYFFAGTSHGPSRFPPESDRKSVV